MREATQGRCWLDGTVLDNRPQTRANTLFQGIRERIVRAVRASYVMENPLKKRKISPEDTTPHAAKRPAGEIAPPSPSCPPIARLCK